MFMISRSINQCMLTAFLIPTGYLQSATELKELKFSLRDMQQESRNQSTVLGFSEKNKNLITAALEGLIHGYIESSYLSTKKNKMKVEGSPEAVLGAAVLYELFSYYQKDKKNRGSLHQFYGLGFFLGGCLGSKK